MIGNHKCYIILTTKERSTRLDGKNMMICHDKPLCRWVADECLKASFIDGIYHISDGIEIKDLMGSLGIINIDEPQYLTLPFLTILSVLKHVVNIIPAENNDYIIWADVSKPLTKYCHIEKCIRAANEGNWDSVFTTKKLRYNLIGDAPIVTQLKPQHETKYLYWGAVRLRTKETILKSAENSWGYGEHHLDLPICEDHEVDVDYLHDLIMAEALLKAGY